jgi:hypothetical protein
VLMGSLSRVGSQLVLAKLLPGIEPGVEDC